MATPHKQRRVEQSCAWDDDQDHCGQTVRDTHEDAVATAVLNANSAPFESLVLDAVNHIKLSFCWLPVLAPTRFLFDVFACVYQDAQPFVL